MAGRSSRFIGRTANIVAVKRALQIAVIAAAVAVGLAPIDPGTVERRFSTTVYPAIQRLVTPVSNAVPFALFDLLTIAGAVALVLALVHGIRRARRERTFKPLLTTMARIATAGAVVYLAFLLLWGFNYRRVPMTERLVMDRPPPATDAVAALGLEAVGRLNALHAEAHRIGWTRDPRENVALLEAYRSVQQRLSDALPAAPGRLKQ